MIYVMICIIILTINFIIYALCKITAKTDEEIESINRREAD